MKADGESTLVGDGWVKLGEFTREIGMRSRHNARKWLQRLERATGQTILRRVGDRWEVSREGLRRARSDQPERRIDDLEERLILTENRVDSLREVGARFRKSTRKILEDHEKRIAANYKLAVALAEAREANGDTPERHATARNGTHDATGG